MSGIRSQPRALAAITLLVLLLVIPPVHGALTPVQGPYIDDASDFAPTFTMNRVQKYAFGGEWTYKSPQDFTPSFKISALYATGTKTWYPSLFVEQPLLESGDLHAWVRASRLAEPYAFDDRIITEEENIVAAFFAREDFFDYTEIRRVAWGLRIGPVAEQTLTAGLSKERHETMNRRTQKAGFWGDDTSFPINPLSTNMEPTLLTVRYDWQSPGGWSPWSGDRWYSRTDGAWLTYEGWWSDPDIGGDLTMSRQQIEARVLVTPDKHVEFRFRAAAGWTPYGHLRASEGVETGFAVYPGFDGPRVEPEDARGYVAGPGRVPPQWTFHAGGLGTLRGHENKEFVGDHLFLANAEYVLRTSPDFGLVLFTDLGRAWYENVEDINSVDDLAWDGGVGVELSDVRIQLGQDLRDFEREPRLTFRWHRAF